jgi:thiamine-phosphate pyrophosphorylase
MRARQTPSRAKSRAKSRGLPDLWLLSDERNDAVLEQALRHLPRGSGFVYRHYHLPPEARIARWFALLRVARARGHLAILADSALSAREWGADGLYGAPRALYPTRTLLTLATAHSLRELAEANRARADAVLLSPVFPTRSHPGTKALGPLRFRLMARRAAMPVIALGGVNPRTAHRLCWHRWAAIDGLS